MVKELISIIVPCYNVGPYLSETLESVLNQTYVKWECVIVNDGSPDNTREVALEWEKKDKRFIYLELQNGGVERARNKGIEKASGEFILPLDGDDKLAPTFLRKALQIFKDNPETMLVYSLVELFEAQQGLWQQKQFSLQNLAAENMIVCTALYRKKEWERVGGYDEMDKYHLEDWEFWINILKGGGKVVMLNEVLFYYRIRPSSGLRSQTDEKRSYMRKYISSKHYDFFQEQLGDVITLHWEKENLKLETAYLQDLTEQLLIRNRIKRLIKSPIRAVNKVKQIFTGSHKRSV